MLGKDKQRICLLGNQHGLLQYLLLSSLDEVEQTFFLWNYVSIPDSVILKFGKSGAIIPNHNMTLMRIANYIIDLFPFVEFLIKCFLLFFFYRIYYPLKYPFILNSKLEFWGHDHVFNAHCFLRDHSFCLLEDGTANYVPYPFFQTKQRFIFIKKMIGGRNYGDYLRYMGDEDRCSAIYLTGLSDKGEVLKDPKVKVKSFPVMWNEASLEKKNYINDIFGVSSKLISECSKLKHILLTEPLSEDGLLSENEKIELYRDIVKRIQKDNVVIKPHPRDKTDYSSHISNVYVLNTCAPMQLLTLNGVRFETAYSIRSSALFDFPYKIKVCVIGTEVHPILFQKYPDWSSDKIKASITNKNIELINL